MFRIDQQLWTIAADAAHKLIVCMFLSFVLRVQYLVFEYVEKTLLEVLEARRGGLNPEEVCRLDPRQAGICNSGQAHLQACS